MIIVFYLFKENIYLSLCGFTFLILYLINYSIQFYSIHNIFLLFLDLISHFSTNLFILVGMYIYIGVRYSLSGLNLMFLLFILLTIYSHNWTSWLHIFELISLQTFHINTRLTNGLFLIHPFLVYSMYALIFVLARMSWTHYVIYCILDKYIAKICLYRITDFTLSKRFYSLLIYVFMFSFAGLILGSWWAFQEVGWNGWWNWDIIELLNFVLVLPCLWVIHINKSIFGKVHTLFFSSLTLVLSLWFFITSRYNISVSIHSFVVFTNLEQFVYYIFIILGVALLGFCILVKVVWSGKSIIKYSLLKVRLNVFSFLFLSLSVVYILILFEEYILFLFGTSTNYNLYFICSLINLLLFSTFVGYSHYLFTILVSWWAVSFILIILTNFFLSSSYILFRKTKTPIYVIHLFVFCFFVLFFLSKDLDLFFRRYSLLSGAGSLLLINLQTMFMHYKQTIVCNSFWLDYLPNLVIVNSPYFSSLVSFKSIFPLSNYFTYNSIVILSKSIFSSVIMLIPCFTSFFLVCMFMVLVFLLYNVLAQTKKIYFV